MWPIFFFYSVINDIAYNFEYDELVVLMIEDVQSAWDQT